MPLALSNDLILAGIHDIFATALANPSANSPLAPLTDSHHREALRTVTLILAGKSQSAQKTKPPSQLKKPTPASIPVKPLTTEPASEQLKAAPF